MSDPITILVGTMTGTAELVAQEVSDTLQAKGHETQVLMMDGLDASVFAPGGVFLVVTSTYGNGDVPDNAQALFGDLQAHKTDLSRVVYGLIALGDITYKATFCNGGLEFDRTLTRLGAKRAGAPLLCDASSGDLAEDLACAWVAHWIDHDLTLSLAA